MPATLAQLAEALGVSKMTVIRNAKRLGIYDGMQRKGPNATRIMTDEQASLLAHEIAGRTLTAADLGGSSEDAIDDVIALREEVARLTRDLADRDAKIADLGAEAVERDARIAKLEVEAAILRRMRDEDQDCIACLMHAWPWGKRAVFARWQEAVRPLRDRLLPPAGGQDAPE